MKNKLILLLLLVGLSLIVLAERSGALAADETKDIENGEMIVGSAEFSSKSPAVRDLPDDIRDYPVVVFEINPRHNPNLLEPDFGRRGTWERTDIPTDPLITQSRSRAASPPVALAFEGLDNDCNCSPPDVVGDVGLNHYIQMVNSTQVAVFDKAGNSLAVPFSLGNLWPSGDVCRRDDGDPIVVYDELADRWVLTQFARSNHLCFAVSETADPLGSYHIYTYNVSQFPDYFKVGAWTDGYYVSANESSYTAYAFDRVAMLAGEPSPNFVKFTGQNNLLLPSDIDGIAPPVDAPNYFYTFKDDSYHGGVDRIEVYEFSADFQNTSNSTFSLVATLPVASFTYTACGFFNFNCIYQPGTSTRVDSLGEWPMFSFRYRNFEDYEALVGTFGVGGGTGEAGAAIRWFELRKTDGDWSLYQEGTHDVGDGHDRFNASIAMDACGNIALGYVASSSTLFPSIRYATRLASDPIGTLGDEQILIDGSGSQSSSNRWGDYATMSVDPADGATFWFTNEYYTSSGSWKTHIGNFAHQECLAPTFTLQVQPTMQSSCVDQLVAFTIDTVLLNGFAAPITLSTDVLSATTSFSVNPITSTQNSILTLSDLVAGTLAFNLQGDGDGQSKSQPLTVEVNGSLPTTTTLLLPSPGATNVSTAPMFSWLATPDVVNYRLQVATDSQFADVVIDEIVTETSFVGSGLMTNSDYFWRVSAENGCGSTQSQATQFTTIPASLICAIDVTFEERIPSDWTTLTSIGVTGWGTTDDGVCSSGVVANGNFAGTGVAACVDSDADGGEVDSYLCSPPIDLTGQTSAELAFKLNYQVYQSPSAEDLFEVVVSTGGANGPYEPALFSVNNDYPVNQFTAPNSGALETVDLSAYAGQTVHVCFHYVANYDWYAHVDDVSLSCTATPPTQVELVETTSRSPLPFTLLFGVTLVGLLLTSTVIISWRRITSI